MEKFLVRGVRTTAASQNVKRCTLIWVSFTSVGRLETMILSVGCDTAVAVVTTFGAAEAAMRARAAGLTPGVPKT